MERTYYTITEISPENVSNTWREEALLYFLKREGYNCGSLNLLDLRMRMIEFSNLLDNLLLNPSKKSNLIGLF